MALAYQTLFFLLVQEIKITINSEYEQSYRYTAISVV